MLFRSASDSEIGLVVGSFGIGALVFRPLSGQLTERFGPKRITIFGAAMFALSTPLMATTSAVPLLLALRLLQATGTPCATIGTLGTGFPDALKITGFTTPDAVQLQASLAELNDAGARAIAMEVSSHGLEQGRVAGTRFGVAVLTNLTQDHLDYHGDMDSYAAAKARLFEWPRLQARVFNIDDPYGRELAQRIYDELH